MNWPQQGFPQQQGFAPQAQPQQQFAQGPAQPQPQGWPPAQQFAPAPQQMAPQGFPQPGMPVQAAPQGPQGFAPPPQYAPQQAAFQGAANQMLGNAAAAVNVAAIMAGATVGGERYPLLENGDYGLRVCETEIGRSGTLKIHFDVLESNNPQLPVGAKVTELLNLQGQNVQQMEARRGAAKRCIMKVAGFNSEPEVEPHLPQIYGTFGQPSSVLVGRLVRVMVRDRGKRTKTTNEIIWDKTWTVV